MKHTNTQSVLRNIALRLALILLVYALSPSSALAQEAFSLSVEPTVTSMSFTNIDTPKTQQFTLTNNSQNSKRILLRLFPIKEIDKKTNRPIYQSLSELTKPQQSFYDTAISFETGGKKIDEIVLAPKQTRMLTIIVTPGPDQVPSEYYFTIGFVDNTPQRTPDAEEVAQSNETTVQNEDRHTQIRAVTRLKGGVGSHMLVSIGDKPANLIITEFETSDVFSNILPHITLSLNNKADRHNRVYGKVSISNMLSMNIGSYTVEETYILSNDSKTIEIMPSSYDLTSEVIRMLSLGRNKATLELYDREKEKTYTRELYYLALPLPGALIPIAGLLFFLYLVQRIKRKLS